MPTKSARTSQDDNLRPEYDLSKLTGGVRGKYYERATAGTTLVLLEPDVAEAFPDGEAVNQALRLLLEIARAHVGSAATRDKPRETPSRPVSPASGRQKRGKSSRAARG